MEYSMISTTIINRSTAEIMEMARQNVCPNYIQYIDQKVDVSCTSCTAHSNKLSNIANNK